MAGHRGRILYFLLIASTTLVASFQVPESVFATEITSVHVMVRESRVSDAAFVELLASQNAKPFLHVESLGGFGRPEKSLPYGKRIYSLSLPLSEAGTFIKRMQKLSYVLLAEQEILGYGEGEINDPLFGAQWGLQKIEAPEAFVMEMGAASTIIGVIDTGVDLDHQDLVSKLLPGYDAVDDDAVPEDDHGHGTRMAGVAAAATMNDEGIAGACPKCMMLPVRAGYNNNGNASFSAYKTMLAFAYALDNPRGVEGVPDNPNPVDVISISASFSSPSTFLLLGVEDAASRGVPVVASAGNQAGEAPRYPAAFPGVISVAATDEDDQRWSGSNYGDWVTLAAPGVNIWTTSLDGTYTTSTGTSPAAPFVAGTIALMHSRAEGMTLTPDDIRGILLESSDPVSGFPEIVGGRVNAHGALELTPNGHMPPYTPRFKTPFPVQDGGS